MPPTRKLLSVLSLLPLLLPADGRAQSASREEKTAAFRADLQARFGEKVEVLLDQPYAETANYFQMADVYLPKTRLSDKPLPVVVFIHGGGWSGGDRRGYAPQAAALASTGRFAAVSVGYRLSGEAKWPAQIHDCKAAIRWIRGQANTLKLDPDRIGATGASAGGHLVTLLGVSKGVQALEGSLGAFTSLGSGIQCVVNFCGPTDLSTALMQGEGATKDDPAVAGLLGGPLSEKQDLLREASPLTYVTASAVPIMSVHGTKDLRVNFSNAQKLDAALRSAGAQSLLLPIVNAGHGIPVGKDLAQRIQQFWDLHLRGEPSDISTAPIEVPPEAPKK